MMLLLRSHWGELSYSKWAHNHQTHPKKNEKKKTVITGYYLQLSKNQIGITDLRGENHFGLEILNLSQ